MEVISINVAGKSLELGAQPSYGAFNDLCQGEDRTGLRLWALPARRVVKFLESAPSLVRGKRVVELGCGAHAALARASVLLGASTVLATDGSSHIVELASAHGAGPRRLQAEIRRPPASEIGVCGRFLRRRRGPWVLTPREPPRP